jgi:hypothetical protein
MVMVFTIQSLFNTYSALVLADAPSQLFYHSLVARALERKIVALVIHQDAGQVAAGYLRKLGRLLEILDGLRDQK